MHPRRARPDAGRGVATTVGAGWAVGTAVAVMLLAGAGGFAVTGAQAAVGSQALPASAPTGTCSYALPTAGIQGVLSVEGGPLASEGGDRVPLTYSYGVAYTNRSAGGGPVVAEGCLELEGNVTTAANGSFAFDPALPATNCTVSNPSELCTTYTGTYGPVPIGPADGVPAGYALSVSGSTGPIAVTLVYELASVRIDSGAATLTTSVDAPTTLNASVWAANGSASDLSPTYTWLLNGSGWFVDGGLRGPSLVLTAVAGASVATATVLAGAVADNLSLAPVEASVDLVAVPTQVLQGETNRTALDVGDPMEVLLTAIGAAGFPYSATVQPGLGAANITTACAPGAPDDGSVTVTCQANVAYPGAGVAQPTATVTNGYSAAGWTFPDVVVSPTPELEIAPTAPAGYVFTAIPITVTAVNGTGTAPYAEACVVLPNVSSACRASPGPSWSFVLVVPRAGNFSATASAVDAEGQNATVQFPITVDPRLSVGTLVPIGGNATVGVPLELSANVSGGFAPFRYWWNVSGYDGPLLTGVLAADGPLTASWAPTAVAGLDVTVTVVDARGALASSTLAIAVGPAPAERVVPVAGPPADDLIVGDPVPLSWAAFDPSGSPDPSFDAPGVLELRSPAGAFDAWANASGVGALTPLGNDSFGIPSSGWVGGYLNLSIAIAAATGVEVELVGPGLPGPVSPINLTFQPDRDHLRLFDPEVLRAGGRSNATLWRAEDRYGNPVPGARLAIDLSAGGARDVVGVVAIPLPGGGSGVWINVSAPSAAGGVVTVFDAAGDEVLGPLAFPPAPSGASLGPAIDALAAVAPAGTAGAAAFAVVRRRRRQRRAAPAEEELRGLAEGRARAVELIGGAGALDLAGLEAAWGGSPPPALADWVASLVADGTLRATIGNDGRPRFCLAPGPPSRPRVTVDEAALDRTLQRQRDERDEGSGGDG